jgi:hypothetical protein
LFVLDFVNSFWLCRHGCFDQELAECTFAEDFSASRCEIAEKCCASLPEVRERVIKKRLVIDFGVFPFDSPLRWSQIITNEPMTMRKFTLKLHNDFPTKGLWVDKFDEIISLDRNFQSIDVNADETHAHNAVELFVEIASHHGAQIRSLTLHKTCFKHSNDFCEILRNVPLLERLEVSRTKFQLDESEKNYPSQAVALAHLKTIIVHYSSWMFLQYLMGSKISSLIMSTAQVRKHEREILINFLEDSDMLDYIEVGREAFERIFDLKFENDFPFQLTKLKFFSYVFKNEFNQVGEKMLVDRAVVETD